MSTAKDTVKAKASKSGAKKSAGAKKAAKAAKLAALLPPVTGRTQEDFQQLVRSAGGFEVCYGFREDCDILLGGKGDTLWYYLADEDFCLSGKNGDIRYLNGVPEAMPAGTVSKLILTIAYAGQDEIAARPRKSAAVTFCGFPALHYAYDFGERGYDISAEHGITLGYSDIGNEQAGFRVRSIVTGDGAEPPKA